MQAHVQAHPLEHVFYLCALAGNFFKQVFGIQAIGTGTGIAGGLPGRGGVGQEGVGRRIHLREALGHCAVGAKRVVAAGIQNNDIGAVFGSLKTLGQISNVQRVVAHIVCIIEGLVDRQQVVAPVQLHTVAGKIEQARLLGSLQQRTESQHRCLHLLTVLVDHLGHAKA